MLVLYNHCNRRVANGAGHVHHNYPEKKPGGRATKRFTRSSRALREARELLEVGLSFLFEGVSPFFRFVRCVEK